MPDDHASRAPIDVLVLGAGMVGVSTAIAMQRQGLTVALLDRREPGRETSYGNAGILSSGSVIPLNNPGLWKNLPRYAANLHPALRWRLGWALGNIDWSLRFLANATEAATRPRSAALAGLLGPSIALHRRWIVEAGAASRLRETGWIRAWRCEARAAAEAEQAALAAHGIGSELLDRQTISALEPAIKPIYPTGLLHTDTASVDSPGAIVEAYACLFAAAGGAILRGEARALARQGEAWRVTHSGGEVAARHVVVALGPWSADLLSPLGYRTPLAVERGYHQEFRSDPSRPLSRPIHDLDGGFVIAPMENGIRITTGVELAGRDAPSSFVQRDLAVPKAREVVPLGEPVGETWRGARPTLPDSLPMIGPAPRHPGLWLAFGHQHIGFTTGPGTGAALAAMIAGAPPPFDVVPFAPARYL